MNEKEESALAAALREYISDQKRSRRNRNIFRILYVLLFVFLIYSVAKTPQFIAQDLGMDGSVGNPEDEHIALVRIVGPILETGNTSANEINRLLEEAFAARQAKAIIIELNTPGGSPVQSDRIAETILRLSKEHEDKPIYAVVSDVCASGGMYIAAVTDAIYANRASIVGSIGVIFSGFGFTEMIDKIGVERRLLTAGKNKAMLDPFTPLKEIDKQHAQTILDEIHQQFIQRVRSGRGDKLSDNPNLFSGLYWTGEQAQKIGLVDDFGDSHYVANEVLKLDNIVEYQQAENLLQRFSRTLIAALHTYLQSFFYQTPVLH